MDISTGSKFFIAGEPFKILGFENQSLNVCELRLFLSPNQLVCAIIDGSQQVVFLQPFEPASSSITFFDFVKAVLSSINHFKKDCRKKVVMQLNENFAVVPSAFSDNDFADGWKNSFVIDGNYLMCHDAVKTINAEVVYSLDLKLKELLDEHVSDYSIQHVVANSIDFLIRGNEGKTVYCNVHSGFMQVVFLDASELEFVNIFHYQSPEDFIYYLLAVYKMLDLDPEQEKIVLLGEIVKDSAMYKLVYKYIRNIEFGKMIDKKVFPENYPFPFHFYFSLLT